MATIAHIFYRRQIKTFRDPDATLDTLPDTHRYLCTLDMAGATIADKDLTTNLDRIYRYMQAECWSPNGEDRRVVEAAGIYHTSMSMGDVVSLYQDGTHRGYYEVAAVGWRKVT